MTAADHDTVWVNCSAGVAGDMLLAGLIDAGADRLAVANAWLALGVDGYAVTWERVSRGGIEALWTNLVIDTGEHGEHEHEHTHGDGHGHGHGHGHDHAHRPAGEVIALVLGSDLDPWVADAAARVYRQLAVVEGAIHGVDPDTVELHEVGALDSILDIVGVCAALRSLGDVQLGYSPVAIGHGSINTAHGRVPNPAPATARLLALAGASTVGLDTTMETATPTGVALLAVLGTPRPSPTMTVTGVGYGAGTADPAGRANVVQVLVGSSTESTESTGSAPSAPAAPGEHVTLVEVNVDDITGEVVAYTIARLLAVGALDAWATPIVMKKGRPAYTISALSDAASVAVVRATMLAESGSLGVRATAYTRWPQRRTESSVAVDGHVVRVKLADGRFKVEFDDAATAAAALAIPLREVLARAEELARATDFRAATD